MAKAVEDLQAEVLSLPPAERSLLRETMIVSLDADPEIQPAWVGADHRRDSEIESGEVALVAGDKAYDGNATITTQVGGQPQRMTMDMTGRWLGADCGDLKPVGALPAQ